MTREEAEAEFKRLVDIAHDESRSEHERNTALRDASRLAERHGIVFIERDGSPLGMIPRLPLILS